MKTATILSLVLTTATLHAKGFVPSPSSEEPRARTGQQVTLKDVKVTATTTARPVIEVTVPGAVELSSIVLDRDFRESPPGNLVRAELEAANGEND